MAKRPTGPALLSSSAPAQPRGAPGWHGLRTGDRLGTGRGRDGQCCPPRPHQGAAGRENQSDCTTSPCPGAGSKPAAPATGDTGSREREETEEATDTPQLIHRICTNTQGKTIRTRKKVEHLQKGKWTKTS